MDFKPFEKNIQKHINKYLLNTNYVGSDYSYYAFLSWFDDIEYAEMYGVFFMRATMEGELYYWPPLISSDNTMSIKEAVAMLPEGASFAFCTEDFVDALYGKYRVYTNRDWSEYIYKTDDFISLSGKRYHSKRNHIKKFTANYKSTLKPLTADDADELVAFEKCWLDLHPFDGAYSDSALRESKIVEEWYRAALRGELICEVLRIDAKIAGVTIAEILPSRNAVVMYEKADINYEGVYSFLAHEFAAKNLAHCLYINRQEDMGLEGLRKSKMSYNPEFLLTKYILKPFNGATDCEKRLPKSMSAPIIESKIDNAVGDLADYSFKPLGADDFDLLATFYNRGIARLSDKKFFMNYTPDELRDVLENGYVLGAFFEGRPVSVCAFDPDKVFGKKLAQICGDDSGVQYFEFSGIMTDTQHRGKGLSREVCSRVIEYARQNYAPCVLCAAVQFDNHPSLCNLKKLGFEEKVRAIYKIYDFKYLTLALD